MPELGRACSLDRQDRNDLLNIREPFLSSQGEYGKLIVHGHTPSLYPEIRPNRIGIDTAAYATGRLTCLVLEKDDRRFLGKGGDNAEREIGRWARAKSPTKLYDRDVISIYCLRQRVPIHERRI